MESGKFEQPSPRKEKLQRWFKKAGLTLGALITMANVGNAQEVSTPPKEKEDPKPEASAPKGQVAQTESNAYAVQMREEDTEKLKQQIEETRNEVEKKYNNDTGSSDLEPNPPEIDAREKRQRTFLFEALLRKGLAKQYTLTEFLQLPREDMHKWSGLLDQNNTLSWWQKFKYAKELRESNYNTEEITVDGKKYTITTTADEADEEIVRKSGDKKIDFVKYFEDTVREMVRDGKNSIDVVAPDGLPYTITVSK